MSLREKLTESPILGMGMTAAVVLIVLVVVVVQLRGSRLPTTQGKSFYTNDDGKTWFADDAGKIPPFDKDGKPAVRAYVYRGNDGKDFVGYLERYNAKAKQIIDEASKPLPAGQAPKNLPAIQGAYAYGSEFKLPGESKWCAASSAHANQIMTVKTSTGSAAQPVDP